MAMTTAPQRGPHRAERLFGSAYPHRTLGLFWRCFLAGVAGIPLGLVAVSRSGDQTSHRTDCSSDGGAEGRTVSAGGGSSDRRPAACADEAATDRSLDRIIWIGAARQA